MSLSNKHYSATCQSCGYNTEITEEILSQDFFFCKNTKQRGPLLQPSLFDRVI